MTRISSRFDGIIPETPINKDENSYAQELINVSINFSYLQEIISVLGASVGIDPLWEAVA